MPRHLAKHMPMRPPSGSTTAPALAALLPTRPMHPPSFPSTTTPLNRCIRPLSLPRPPPAEWRVQCLGFPDPAPPTSSCAPAAAAQSKHACTRACATQAERRVAVLEERVEELMRFGPDRRQ
eukprot:358736-Chlamydomonas_euryale.AAC.6